MTEPMVISVPETDQAKTCEWMWRYLDGVPEEISAEHQSPELLRKMWEKAATHTNNFPLAEKLRETRP